MTSSLTILSSKFCKMKQGIVLNETYQNGVEDLELSIELNRYKSAIIDYKIGDVIGGTLGNGPERSKRDLMNLVYFQERVGVLLRLK